MLVSRRLYFQLLPFLGDCSVYITQLAVPIVAVNRFDASPTDLGILGAGVGIGYAVMAVVAGSLSDRTGRRRWSIVGALSQVVLGIALALCDDLRAFMLVAILQNSLLGCFWAPLMGLMSESTPPRRIPKVLAQFNVSWATGGMTGAFIAGQALQAQGFRAPFLYSIVMMCACLLIVAAGPPAPCAPRPGDAESLPLHPRAARMKHLAWLAMGASFFVISALVYIYPKLAEGELKLSPFLLTALHGARMAAIIATFGCMGAWGGWHFRRGPFHLVFALLVTMVSLAAAVASYPLHMLAFVGVGVAVGIAYVLSAYYSMLSPSGRGSMMGIHEALLSTGSTLGPLYGGWVLEATGSLRAPFWWSLAPLGIAWLAYLVMASRLRPAHPARVGRD